MSLMTEHYRSTNRSSTKKNRKLKELAHKTALQGEQHVLRRIAHM